VLAVDNINPTAVCAAPGAVDVAIGANGTAIINANSINNGSSDNCSFTLSVAPTMVDCDDIGTPIPITLIVTDASGNVATCNTTVDVVDVAPPVSTMCGTTIVLTCPTGGTVTLDTSLLEITDNCTATADVYIEFFEITEFDENYIGSTIYIPFIMEDEYGNLDFCDVNVEIVGGPLRPVKMLPITVKPTEQIYVEAKGFIAVNPNPMQDFAMVTYKVPVSGKVRVIAYDDNGRMLETLYEGNQDAGEYTVEWNNQSNAAGTHYVVLTVDGKRMAFKPVVIARK
jgi:hypothetical protein